MAVASNDFSRPTLDELTTRVRDDISEPDEGFALDPQIHRWLNRAQLDFQMKTKILRTYRTLDGGVQANVRAYALPPDYQRMEMVVYDSRCRLEAMDLDQVTAMAGANGLTKTGEPLVYYTRGGKLSERCIYLWRVPSAGVAGKTLEFYYEQKPNELLLGTDQSLFDAEWSEALILFARERFYMKDGRVILAREARDEYMRYVREARQRRNEPETDRPSTFNDYRIYDRAFGDDLSAVNPDLA